MIIIKFITMCLAVCSFTYLGFLNYSNSKLNHLEMGLFKQLQFYNAYNLSSIDRSMVSIQSYINEINGRLYYQLFPTYVDMSLELSHDSIPSILNLIKTEGLRIRSVGLSSLTDNRVIINLTIIRREHV